MQIRRAWGVFKRRTDLKEETVEKTPATMIFQPDRMLLCVNIVTTVSSIFLPDINECQEDNGGCQHTCTNTPGSFVCACHSGYSLDVDKKSCQGNERNLKLPSPAILFSKSRFQEYSVTWRFERGSAILWLTPALETISNCQLGKSYYWGLITIFAR